MIEEVIGNIIDAENKADSIIKDSQVKAKEMVAKAKDVSVVAVEEEKKRIEIDLTNEYNNAVAKSEEMYRTKLEEVAAQADKQNKNAQKNMDKSIEYVIGRLTSKYDM